MHSKYSMRPMMQPMSPMYPYPAPHGAHAAPHGFCSSCCHPVAQCCCKRSCRKIEKELLAQPKVAAAAEGLAQPATDHTLNIIRSATTVAEPATARILALMDLIAPPDLAAIFAGEKAAAENKVGAQGVMMLRSAVATNKAAVGMEHTVIGGGCCVHLSIEYMPVTPVVPVTALSGVLVMDSKATVLSWIKLFSDGGYHVKEGIISTNPGAHLWVLSVNAITRVRWCEVISC